MTDDEREDEAEMTEHSFGCGCRGCDPDFYFDPAELDAGMRDF